MTEAKAKEKLLRSHLASLNATLSTDELRARVFQLSREKVEVLARLGPLQKGEVKPVSKGERDEVEREWEM